ncbi:MAG: hypothetical protein WC734_04505 [Patescibacteria group bacterium]|jgi:hypothetical protein
MLRAVAVVTGWELVDVDDDATIEAVLAAAGYVKRDDDEVWTELDSGPSLGRTINSEQVVIILREPPDLDQTDDDGEDDEDEDEDDVDGAKSGADGGETDGAGGGTDGGGEGKKD